MKRDKAIAAIAFASLGLFFLIVESGRRLPYLYSSDALYVRLIVFCFIFAFLAYFSFIYKWSAGSTGAQMVTKNMSKRKIFTLYCKVLISQCFIAGGIAWISIWVSAWGAVLAPGKCISDSYEIASVEARGSRMILVLLKGKDGENLTLRLTRSLGAPPLRPNGRLCIHGKASLFGVSVNQVDPSFCIITSIPVETGHNNQI